MRNYFVNTTADVDVISIIHEVNRTVKEAGVPQGLATVIVPAPGAAVTIVEPLPDIVDQLKAAIRIFPGEGIETKDRRKEDIAVGPRIAAAMLGKTLQIPISGGKLVLGAREEIVLIDMEAEGMRREFCVQVMGEAPEVAPKGPAPRRR